MPENSLVRVMRTVPRNTLEIFGLLTHHLSAENGEEACGFSLSLISFAMLWARCTVGIGSRHMPVQYMVSVSHNAIL